MTMKFMPGPWTVAETYIDTLDDGPGGPETVIRGLDGEAGIAVALDFGPNNPGWRDANAQAIAEVPNLITTLIQIARMAESGEHGIADIARAAIDKATKP